MPASAAEISAMVQIDVSIITPFLKGTEHLSEDKVTDEVFALKEFVDSLGEAEVKKTVVKLSSENRHEEILPTLEAIKASGTPSHASVKTKEAAKAKEEEAAKAKKGGRFQWLFKGKDKDEKEKGREREKEKEKEKEKDDKEKEGHHRKHSSPKASGAHSSHASPPAMEEIDRKSADFHETQSGPTSTPASTMAEEPPVGQHPAKQDAKHHKSSAPATSSQPPVAPANQAGSSQHVVRVFPFNQPRVMQREEEELSREYNFRSTVNRDNTAPSTTAVAPPIAAPAATTSGSTAPAVKKEDDFDAIFNQFLQGTPKE